MTLDEYAVDRIMKLEEKVHTLEQELENSKEAYKTLTILSGKQRTRLERLEECLTKYGNTVQPYPEEGDEVELRLRNPYTYSHDTKEEKAEKRQRAADFQFLHQFFPVRKEEEETSEDDTTPKVEDISSELPF